MKAMKQAASSGMMRGPRGGMYRIVGGKKVYGDAHITEPKFNVGGHMVTIGSQEHKKAIGELEQRAADLRKSKSGLAFAEHAMKTGLADVPGSQLRAAINAHYDKNPHVQKEHPNKMDFHGAVSAHMGDLIDAEAAMKAKKKK